jgi:drug/metabolite transporter (DMT)-like permease
VTRAYLGALFAVIVWGASFIATKIARRQTDPFTVICLRFGIGIVVLFAAAAPMMLYVMAGGWVMSAVPWLLAGIRTAIVR